MIPIDEEACRRAIEAIRESNAGAAVLQIEQMLADDPWEDVARFAAYSQQVDNLRLQPWEVPPAWVADIDRILAGDYGDDLHGWQKAARLARRLLDAGLSRYEPDVANALLKVPPAPVK
jgi:hypothetical protein